MIRRRYNMTADRYADFILEEPYLFLGLPHVLW